MRRPKKPRQAQLQQTKDSWSTNIYPSSCVFLCCRICSCHSGRRSSFDSCHQPCHMQSASATNHCFSGFSQFFGAYEIRTSPCMGARCSQEFEDLRAKLSFTVVFEVGQPRKSCFGKPRMLNAFKALPSLNSKNWFHF